MNNLTLGERREILRMHIAPQNTFGRGRVAIQNRLVAKGLAKLIDDDALCALTDQGTAIAIAIRGEKR